VDSPLEEAVKLRTRLWKGPKFPVTRVNTGNFIDSTLASSITAAEKGHQTKGLRANSLRIGTGIFLRALQGIQIADQGIFRPDQGILDLGSAIWASPKLGRDRVDHYQPLHVSDRGEVA
jgi:hypothetical protein